MCVCVCVGGGGGGEGCRRVKMRGNLIIANNYSHM